MKVSVLSINVKNRVITTSVFLFLYFALFPVPVYPATLFVSPSSSSVVAGNIFTVNIVVNTEGQNINTSDAVIQFPTDLLQVVSVSKGSSIFSLWVEDPNFSNTTGQISFNGGIANPGYLGNYGQLISITFKAKKSGTASLIFSDSSVRANDGLGTDVLSSKSGGLFTITNPVAPAAPAKTVTPPVVVPEKQAAPEVVDEPKEDLVVERNPEISIGLKNGVQAVFGLSSQVNSEVVLSFVSTDGTKIFITDKTLPDGSFSLTVPRVLRSGSYTVKANVKKLNDSKIYVSNEIKVSVGSGLMGVGIPVLSLMVILFTVIVGLLVYIFTHLRKHKNKSSLKHDLHEAENVLHKSFDILREDVSDYAHEKMHSASDRKNATALEKEIDDAESVISSKIREIEK